MRDGEKLLIKRFEELDERALSRGCFCYTDFLTLSEQDILLSVRTGAPVCFSGGFEHAERKVARFGSAGWDEPFPVKTIFVEPLSLKNSENLCHRDFLGALLGCGIRREKTGDIVVDGNCAYVVCVDSVADYIKENLSQVRHTVVKTSFVRGIPDSLLPQPHEETMLIASERLDALISAVYNLSRSESREYFLHGKVFVNSRLTENAVYRPLEDDVVSVRGLGRFIYCGTVRETQKGKLWAAVKIYK